MYILRYIIKISVALKQNLKIKQIFLMLGKSFNIA